MSDDSPYDDTHPATEHVRPQTGALKNPYGRPGDAITPPERVRFITPDGVVLDVASQPYIVLGRAEKGNQQQVDVDFGSIGGPESGVSRCHAILQVTRDSVLIKDFNSRNGTFINGFELHPMRDYALNDGDEVILGRVKTRVAFVY